MSDAHRTSSADPVAADHASREPTDEAAGSGKPAISMHANVPVWYDCCSCEAEPYWQQAMAAADPEQQDRSDAE